MVLSYQPAWVNDRSSLVVAALVAARNRHAVVRYALTAPEVTPLMKYFMPTENTISCGSVATM